MVAGASTVERRAELMVDSPDGQRSVRLQSGSTYLGRGEDAQILLPDDILEARHLEFDWDGAELWLIYLGKGVRPVVNGQLTAERQLASGDVIEIGDAKIRVRILRRNIPGGAAADAPAAAGEVPAESAPEQAPVAPPRELPPEERVRLEYTVHQLVQQRRRGTIIVAALVAFFGVMWFFIIPGNTFMMAISLLIILGSVSAFLFPVHYKLTDAGVEIRGVLLRDSKKWTRFERYVIYPDAVQLLVSQRSLRGRVVKGSLVYFRDNRDEVLAVVREKLGDKAIMAKGTAPRS
ncbi:MAG: FHA domain-containing protein [Bacillota bacterium]|nr:FHA domain-containing protein [Bacillota bacterium]